jgi:hypothetical protein
MARRTFTSGPPGISTPAKKDMSALTAFLGKGPIDGTGYRFNHRRAKPSRPCGRKMIITMKTMPSGIR